MTPEKMRANSTFHVTIATGLSGFSMLSRIAEVSGETIAAWAELKDAPRYLGLEAMAQAACYHIRFLWGFERQAVLLMIRDCGLPAEERLSGRCELSGRLRSRSASVFSYEMSATMNGKKIFEGEFVFTAVTYNSELRGDILKEYYEKKWADLRNG